MPVLFQNLLILLAASLLAIPTLPLPPLPSRAQDIITIRSPYVHERMELMRDADMALKRLEGMTTGRNRFDADRAQQARRELRDVMGQIPGHFRKRRTEPASRASPGIWLSWDDFRARARTARRAARSINTSSLGRLRRTLPPMITACLNCHRTYRRPP